MTDTPELLAAYKRLALAELAYTDKDGDDGAERRELYAARVALRALLAPEREDVVGLLKEAHDTLRKAGRFSQATIGATVEAFAVYQAETLIDRAIAALGREGERG